MGKFLLIVGLLAALGGGYYLWTKSGVSVTPESVTTGKIIVGTDATYPPLEFLNEKGEIAGFDIDLAREIAKDMRANLEVRNVSFDEVFKALKAGEVDLVISSVTITTERQKEMLFSAPYLNAGQVIVVKSQDRAIFVPSDLSGKKVGVQVQTTSEIEAKKYTSQSLVLSYADYDKAKVALVGGKIDAIIIDYPAGVSMAQGSGGALKVVGNPFTSEFYGVVAPLGKNELVDSVNKTISRLKTQGKLGEIEHFWFKR